MKRVHVDVYMPMKTNIMSSEQQEHAYRICIEIVSVQQETAPILSTNDKHTDVTHCYVSKKNGINFV